VFPKIILNCAASADGKIALPDRKKLKLSNKDDFKRVHKLRSKCDAILVGIGTIIEDNPTLTARNKHRNSKNPMRIILDTNFQIPKHSNALNEESKTIIAIGEETQINRKVNAEIIRCGTSEINLLKLLPKLKKRGVETMLVEGGETVMWSFLNQNLFDEFYIFIANVIIGGTNTPTIAGGQGNTNIKNILQLELDSINSMADGILLKYIPKS